MPRVIDLSKYQQAESEKPEAEPVVVVVKSKSLPAASRPLPTAQERTKPQLLAQLDEQMLEVRRDRNKVSNRARERWKAGADETELASLYVTINSFTGQMQKLWDKRDHVERFGVLPQEVKPQNIAARLESSEVAVLKLEKKKLEEKKSKLRAKLKPNAKAPYNSARKILWQSELDQAEAQWQELDQKIKKIQYDARGTDGR